tara:strand:+ start:1031 stop:1171 length:141 start_codon:yes stop_codon:yes gene_type:complete
MIQNILIKIMKEFFISISFGIGLGCIGLSFYVVEIIFQILNKIFFP